MLTVNVRIWADITKSKRYINVAKNVKFILLTRLSVVKHVLFANYLRY